MNKLLRLNLLGSPQILVGDQPLTGFATNKAQALLFYLAVTANTGAAQPTSHSREALAALLWGEMTDVKAKQNLRAVLPDLRRLVGDYLRIERQTIAFDLTDPCLLDVAVIRRDLTPKPSLVDMAVRETAVNLYRNEFLSGFHVQNAPAFEAWVIEQREQLHILVVNALFALVNEHMQRPDFEPALAANRRLLLLEPWSEPAHRQQMLLLAKSGQRSAALTQFEACQKILAAEFGVGPLAETIALFEQIQTGEVGGEHDPQQQKVAAVKSIAKDEQPLQPKTQGLSGNHSVLVNGHDLPYRIKLFGRQPELARLQKWISGDGCRLVGIVGIGGQGKSTLAAAFVRALAEKQQAVEDVHPADLVKADFRFQHIIWRSLLNAPPLAEVMQEWFYTLSGQTVTNLPDSLDQQFSQLLDFLRRQRTLLILDNLESILQADGHSGTYRPGYEAYGQLIRQMAKGNHRSCLLLTGRERPQGLARLEEETPAVRVLSLAGLPADAGRQMLQARGLVGDSDSLGTFVQQYSGNPLALKLAAETVQEIFAGSVDRFLRADALVFDDIRDVLDQQFARLMPLERELLIWLAVVREPAPFVLLRDLLAQPPAAPRYVLEAVRSLQRRSLLEQHETGFGLQNVVLEYMTDLLVENVVRELVDDGETESHFVKSTPDRSIAKSYFNCFALILAQTKAYVRDSQRRLLLKPVAEQLVAQLGVRGAEKRLQTVLARLRMTPAAPGYTAANLLHLLLELGIDLRGYDFSRLYLRQLYLRGVSLPQTDFSHAQLIDSVFTEPFGLVYSVAVSPDGRFMAAGTGEGGIYIWRTADQQLAHVWQGHQQAVDSLAFEQRISENGESHLLLASAGNDGRIGVLSLAKHDKECWRLSLTHPQQGRLIFVSVDGRLVTGVDTDGRVFIWDIANHQKPRVVHQFASAPTRFGLVAYIKYRQIIVIGQRKGIAQLHNANTGELLFSFEAEEMNTILSLAVSQDGQMLAVGGNEGHIGLWRVADDGVQQIGQQHVKMTSSAVDALAFSQDGKTLASTHGVGDNMVRLWSIDEQKGLQLSHTLPGHNLTIWAATFGLLPTTAESNNGAATQQLLITGSSDQTVRVWDVATGQPLYTQRGQPRALSAFDIHPLAKQFPPSSDCSDVLNQWLLAAAGYDELVHLWEGQGAHAAGKDRILYGSKQALYAIAISPNGRFLASAGHSQIVYLWEIATGKLLQSFRGHTNSIYTVGFHPDGNLLASGSTDCTVCLWHINQQAVEGTYSDQPVAVIQAHPQIFYSAEFSADGRFLATVGSDLSLRLWDMTQPHYPELDSLQKIVDEPGEQDIVSVAFSPDGSLVAGGGSRVIHLWAIQDNEAICILRQHTLSILSLAFSPDGQLLVSGGHDAIVCVWEIASGALLHVLHEHEDTVYKVDFTPDGAFVLSCGLDGAIKFWDVQTGECVNTLRVEEPYAGMNITGIRGVSKAQISALQALGAIEA